MSEGLSEAVGNPRSAGSERKYEILGKRDHYQIDCAKAHSRELDVVRMETEMERWNCIFP